MLNIWLLVISIHFIREIVYSDDIDDIHEPPLDTEAERPRGFGAFATTSYAQW